MPETGAKASSLGETLKRKVGPFPLGIWLAAGLGVWWYVRKQQEGQGGPAQQAGNTPPATGYGIDPAGNTGYIDPSTGYVYGSAEDVAALQSQGLIGAPATGTDSGTGASGSNMAGTSTTTPGAPGTGTGGTPTASPPPASTSRSWRYPAPGGLAASNVNDKGFSLHWNPVTGPAGQHPKTYTVATYQMNGKKVDQFTSGSTSTKEYGAGGRGLHPGWQYRVNVWANGGPQAPPHASIVVTLKPK